MDTHCRTVTSGYTPSVAAPSYTCQRGTSHLHYFDLDALTMPLPSNQHFIKGTFPISHSYVSPSDPPGGPKAPNFVAQFGCTCP